MSTPEQRMRMAKKVVDFGASRDKKGHLRVYKLPPRDGGGRYEVAGINERFNKAVADRLVDLIEAGDYDRAEELAAYAGRRRRLAPRRERHRRGRG
jgi:hypothetical protein